MICNFRVNFYDEEGNTNENCVMLILVDKNGEDTGTILRFENTEEIEKFADSIKECLKQIREEYPSA